MRGVLMLAALLAMAGAVALPIASVRADGPPDFSGVWFMKETDPEYRRQMRETWLEIAQEDDRVTIRAWEDGGDWVCSGRGKVEGETLRVQWWGAGKRWRGTAELRLRDGELRGTFHRLDVRSDTQYCKGRRGPPDARVRMPEAR